MALAVDGIPVSGSIGKTTYSRNRYGAYTRRRTKPVNPNSTKQNAARAAFRDAVNYWAVNSDLYTQWQTYASQTPWTNKAGQTVYLSAQAMFIRFFTAWAAAGVSPPANSNAPEVNSLGSLNVTLAPNGLESDNVDLTATLGTVTLNNTWSETGGRLIVEVTPGQNISRQFPGSRWAVGAVITGAGTATHALSIPLGSLPFAIAVGQKVWLRVRGLAVTIDNRVSTQQILGPFIVQEST